MSEYQYYEFQTVDRHLTEPDMRDLRALTTRATITPTMLKNVYHYGSFGGDPLTLMRRYFDAFVYVANWGTHQFMLKLPQRLLDPRSASPYEVERALEVVPSDGDTILSFTRDDEEGAGWVDDEESEGWMPALLPLRDDLATGDLRALYLGWLAGIKTEMLDDDATEPPVPAGLGRLSKPLVALTDFLGIDPDLLEVAAESSPEPAEPSSPADLDRWLRALPTDEKDALLSRVARGEEALVGAELRLRSRRETAPPRQAGAGRRTVGELLEAAGNLAEARHQEEARRQAAEEARLQRERAAARERHLDDLAARQDELWHQVEALFEAKRAPEYDRAVATLEDLRDICRRQQQEAAFATRIAALRERYAKRPAILARLDAVDLGT
ncbi:MAG: hypothetical protein ACYC5O_08850 [Anaerolineae bacterium]